MAKYYVYELIDPRNALPFYVGKGSKSRIFAHESDARRGVPGRKCERIRQIWASGLAVERRYVEFFKDEQSAYDFEALRIAELGPETLTNSWNGPGTAQKLRDTGPFRWTPATAAKRSKTIARVVRAVNAGQVWVGHINITADLWAFVHDIADDLGIPEFTKLLAPHNITVVQA